MATERNDLTSINRIAGYLKVPAGKLAINNDNVSMESANITSCMRFNNLNYFNMIMVCDVL